MKTFNTFQKFIASCIVLCFSIQLFAIHQIDGNWEEYGLTSEYDGYYVIATAEDLEEFRSMTNYSSNENNANAVLISDITVNESVLDENGLLREDWETSISKKWFYSMSSFSNLYNWYSGTFDGRNHTISGLYVSDRFYVGFFGYVNDAIIKNLNIEDSFFQAESGVVGGIVGSTDGGKKVTISNCSVNAYIYSNSTMAGGIYGGYEAGTDALIENCVNKGTVVAQGDFAGGICARWAGSIINCSNMGVVIGKATWTGGIVAHVISYGTGEPIVSKCQNIGAVIGNESVGGIAGKAGVVIRTSCNYGTVSGKNNVGGIAGYALSPMENVFNVGAVSGDNGFVGGLAGLNAGGPISYAYNAGLVSNNGYLTSVGGLCGNFEDGVPITLTSCYYDSEVCPFKAVDNTEVAGATPKTTAQMCSSTLFSGFDSDVWLAGTPDVSGDIVQIDNEFAMQNKGLYPQLKNNNELPYAKLRLYNTGTATKPNWETYNPIYTIEDLLTMEGSSDVFVLMNDITEFRNLSDGILLETALVEWTPINLFEGSLYGRGKTISGLCKTDIYSDGGLFAKVQNAVISGVKIKNCLFVGERVGAITAVASGETTIMNCDNYCDISVLYGSVGGGICGYAGKTETEKVTIIKCNNYGALNGDDDGTIGGICGGGKYVDIIECKNYGNLSGGGYGGGIIGDGDMAGNSIIQNCVNNAAISTNAGSIGGIAGHCNYYGSIYDCLNKGNIICNTGKAGGIIGREASGDGIYRCLNLGIIQSNAVAGAICAQEGSLWGAYCYYNSDICSFKAISNKDNYSNYGMTTSELCNGELPSGFSSDYWAIRPAEVRDMKKYYYYPYLKCYGVDSAILAVVRDCHSVTMNFNGGTTTEDVISFYVETEEAQLPRNVVKEGCTFAGWYDNSNYTSAAFIEIPLTETQPKTFYAKWIANNYTITYDLDGGTINSGKNTTYTYGYGVVLPTDVTKNGYTFKGWYDNPQCEGESILAIPANATGNKTYYANWVVNTYNVTFFTYEGIMDTDIDSYTFGKETVLPTDVTKSGYDFGGWYTNDSYSGVAIQSIASNETGDKMYYAKWNKKSYPVSVTFDRAMGSISGIDSYLHGDNAVLKAHADAGYEFAFWSCDDETVLADKNVQDSTLTFVVTSPTELSATFKFKEIVYPAAEFVIGTLKTETEIAPIELATLFESSEGGEISYVVTSSSPNVLLPQIEDGKLYLATMGLQGKATITVTAKLANGNKSSLSAEAVVEYNCNIHVVPTIVNASCYGFSDGSISLAAENDYSYQWIGEEVTTNKIENVKAGNYSVQITDERGCKSLETYTVSQPDEISVEIAEVVNPRCGLQSEIHLNAAGDYTYAWSNGSTEKDLVGAEIGDYSVVVTNPETGCSTTLTQSLELTFQKPQISLVTVSKETGKNLIVWVRENTDQIAYYTIYREGAQSKKYTEIGTVNYSEISVFQDDVAKPMTRQWSYKISATDVCGHETELSEAHTTLHLNEMESMHDGMAELIWQPYEGLDYNSFYIVRETKVNNYTFIDTVTTVPSTLISYTAEVPPLGKSIFYVGVKLDKVIDPKQFMKAESGPFALALSNIAEAENMGNPDAVETMENAVEVSVINHTIFVKNAANKTIEVYEIGGRKIATVNGLETSTIDVVHDGVYFVVVDGKATKVLVK
ncbi:MAG: InlB B-repeat-containing protein [Bacteroidales bacterium]|nr:InlB B-repeat-containing protein [Bacteroidales bacterium]